MVEEILSFHPISDRIGTAGQPTPAQFRDIRAAGYDVVINLAMPDSTDALPNEQELVAGQGMEYVHIPVVWENPTLVDLERFFAAMAAYEGGRVFVHCALNMRASAFVYLYRVAHLAVSPETAREAMLRIWEPNPVWQEFLRRGLAQMRSPSIPSQAGGA